MTILAVPRQAARDIYRRLMAITNVWKVDVASVLSTEFAGSLGTQIVKIFD